MPRTLRPERYPLEFFEITLTAWRSNAPFEVPCISSSEAYGMRTKFYFFFRALDSRSDEGPGPLARRLASAQRLPPALAGEQGWETKAASDILAAVADLELEVRADPPALFLIPKSQNRFALRLRAALDARLAGGAQASLDRLKLELLKPTPTDKEK